MPPGMLARMEAYALPALFLSAFISSSLMPGGSEALFAAMLWHGGQSPAALLLVATAGNTLGGMSSWGIGRLLARRRPAGRMAQRVALERLRRWGPAALLLSWLPFVGDPLCVAAGWLRVHWAAALLLIGLGKAGRYAALLYALA